MNKAASWTSYHVKKREPRAAPASAWLLILKRAAVGWRDDRASSMGAALAFYSAFSLAPLLIIVITLSGMVFGADAARGAIISQLGDLIGPTGAHAVERMLKVILLSKKSIPAMAAGIFILFVTATTVLIELQNALDKIWKAPMRIRANFISSVCARLWSFGIILGFGFLLVVSLVIASAVDAVVQEWRFPKADAKLLYFADYLVSFFVFTVVFAVLFKWLPNARTTWSNVWAGAAVTALLFNLGRFGIGVYLGQSAVATAYASAGSVLILLLWLYYSAQIFLFGAELTYAYASSPLAFHRLSPTSAAGKKNPTLESARR